MILTEFVDYFENRLQISRLDNLARNPETVTFLQKDSEKIYYGNTSKDIKNIAFMVQPHRDICIQAANSGYDTLFSHHRWHQKNALSPVLRDLDQWFFKITDYVEERCWVSACFPTTCTGILLRTGLPKAS